MNKQEPNIEDTIENLKFLVKNQDEALQCSKEIISLKDRYIELCEIETKLHRKENLRLQKTVFWLYTMLLVSSVLHFINFFI